MTPNKKETFISMFIIGGLFFIFGFVTWVNSILIPYFKIACELSNFQSYLVAFAFYISYFVISVPSSFLLKRLGFKKGIMTGLWIMAAGAFIFIPAALTRTYEVFLLGLFTIGSGLAVLQSAANPYITILGAKEKAAQRISIMGICNKGAGILAPLLFATVVLKVTDSELFRQLPQMDAVQKNTALNELIRRVILPYTFIGVVLVGLGVFIRYSPLPEIDTEQESPETDGLHPVKKNIFHFPHLLLGALAIFLHVGTQVIAIDTIIGYANSMHIPLMEAKIFPSYTLFATIGGYLLGIILIPKYIKQVNMFRICTLLGTTFTLLIIFMHGRTTLFGHTADVSIWFVVLLGLANSLIWAGIWPLALQGLGRFTKLGASIMIMGLCGSAILPLVYGHYADVSGVRNAYWVLFPCYLYLAFYAFYGHTIRNWLPRNVKKLTPALLLLLTVQMASAQPSAQMAFAQPSGSAMTQTRAAATSFPVRGFHLDLRVQVMTMDALKDFASKLGKSGINTLIMEWEGTYPFEKNPLIPNRYAYTKAEVVSFIKYCNGLGIDVIPLQQSFGHVEYILRHERYKGLREDQKDYSQVCPLETAGDSALFTSLYTELISTHTSKYIHIGGDETYLLGHDEKCRLKSEQVGKSRLYTDYIKMLCNIVFKLGKTPVLWADIAIKYPEAIKTLPKGTIFVDWNYGWDMNRFGNHENLEKSGFEIWGAPSIRSSPDNYNLTQWEKHFSNIRDFIPVSKKLGYTGIIMTSWSTSGILSRVFESEADITDLYAIRHVYPLSGFNILTAAYLETLQSGQPLNIESFIQNYCKDHFGFDAAQTGVFWAALKTTPYEIKQGKVISPSPMSVQQLADSNHIAVKMLYSLRPSKNQTEYEHFKLMADIRDYYLRYQVIEKQVNEETFSPDQTGAVLKMLSELLSESKSLDGRFAKLNQDFMNPGQIEEENQIRNIKVHILYDRMARNK